MTSTSRTAGFTLIEVSVAMAVGTILVIGVLGLGSGATRFSNHVDDESVVSFEANRAFARLTEILRKTGWNSDASVTYPLLSEDLSELQFRVLQDLDGNGYPFDQTTGDLEWGAVVYTIKRNPDDNSLLVYQGEQPVWTLGRNIAEVEFFTFEQDNTIYLREMRVRVVATRNHAQGFEVSHTAEGSVFMRN